MARPCETKTAPEGADKHHMSVFYARELGSPLA